MNAIPQPVGTDYRLPLHRRRKLVNTIALSLSLAAMAFGLVWLIWILWDTLWLGVRGLSAVVFLQDTPPPNADTGGLRNAIIGSLGMVLAATAVGTPIGILAGIYLGEYGQRGWLGSVTRFINDILLSAPSIVIGLFVYTIIVAQVRKFSAFAGIVALALIVIPVVIRTTENMFELYPEQRAEGEVNVDGENVLTSKQDVALIRAKIGMVFQKPTPFPMSIYDNIAFGVKLFENLPKSVLDDRVEWALRKGALWNEVKDKLGQSGTSLSGGQQQRLCIARGIAVRPEIILFDEPCSALDPISTAKIEELIDELKSDYTVAIVTHNMRARRQ